MVFENSEEPLAALLHIVFQDVDAIERGDCDQAIQPIFAAALSVTTAYYGQFPAQDLR